MDIKSLIGEVAARHNIRLEPDDPMFALVTLNQVVLQEAADRSEARLRSALAEFIDAADKLEGRAGRALAENIKGASAHAHQILRTEVASVGARLSESLHRAQTTQTRPLIVRWMAVGILCALLIFFCGVIVGKTTLIP
jgi:hypothetical protein